MDNAEFGGYRVGDYVIANYAEFDTFQDTYVVSGFTRSGFGEPLVKVAPIGRKGEGTVFYPRELSYEDGSQPA